MRIHGVDMGRIGVVLLYTRDNKYSVYALTAAIESRVRDVDVYLLNMDRQIDVVESIRRLCERYRKLVVGLSFMTTQLPWVESIARLIRVYAPRALLVAGGPHASGDPVGTLLKLGFDLVVYGEGEDTFVDLVEALLGDDDPRVCGTAYIEGDKIVVRKRMRRVDLDSYPPFPYWRGLYMPIEIMRGCSSGCFYCQVTPLFGSPRYRSIDVVVRYAEIMWSRGLRDLRFIAPNSFGYMSIDGIKPRHDALVELLEKLRRKASVYGGRIFLGTFPSEVRPDSVDEDLVREIRKLVDNKRIIVGAQSGSDRVLKAINRRHSVDDVIKAVEILRRHGFEVDVDFIFGLPGEEDEDVERTIDVMRKLVALGARVHAHTFIPLPGTVFDSAPPGRIDKRVFKEVANLVGMGRAYGYWIEQQYLAKMIDDYRRKKVIYTRREQAYMVKVCCC